MVGVQSMTTHTITDVQIREESDRSIIRFDHLVYGSINVLACSKLEITFHLNDDSILTTCQGLGYRSIGYLAFTQVAIKGQFTFCSATHYSLDYQQAQECSVMQKVALRTLASAAQHQVMHHLNKAPYAVAHSLEAFISIANHFLGSNESIEASLLLLLQQHHPSPRDQCYLALCLESYSKLFNGAFIIKNRALINTIFWQHLLFIDNNGVLYLPHHQLDDDSFIALQALSFRAIGSYIYLFDQLGDRDLQIRSRAIFYKKDRLTFFPLSPVAAAHVIVTQMDHHHHAEFFLKDHCLADHEIENLYTIGQALIMINERALLEHYLSQFTPCDYEGSLYLAAWFILQAS